MSFYVKLQGKEVLEKIILVLEKSLKSPWIQPPPQILYAPWLSYHPFFKSVLKNAFCQLISTRLNAFLAFLFFIVEHSGDKQKRKTKELTKGTLHVTCTFLYPLTEPILSVSTAYKE